MTDSPASALPVEADFVAGMDAGGTKVSVLDTKTTNLHRFPTSEYHDMYAVLEDYFRAAGARPCKIVIAIGGLRDDETGDVRVTNVDWPLFSPSEAERRYPGTKFETVHDLAGAAAGALYASSMNLRLLKPGGAKDNGPIIAVTIGTGVGICTVITDPKSKKRIFFSGEGGHIGFQPYNEAERRHLAHLYKKHEHPSIELAINGKHGMNAWVEHSPELEHANVLKAALNRAIEAGHPIGAVLLEFATEGFGEDRTVAHTILNHMGTLAGNVLADYALAYRATGGIYLTGSVSLGLAEYWADHTGFKKAFMRRGTQEHASWMESLMRDIPIYLLTDPHVAAAGALALAKQD